MKVRSLIVVGLLTALPVLAYGAPPAADTTSYAIPVEHLPLAKGKGGFGQVAFSTAGYNFTASTEVKDVSGLFAVSILGSNKTKKRVVVTYAFDKDGGLFDRGACTVTSKITSGLWNKTENGLYTCQRQLGGSGPDDFLLEAEIPNFVAESGSGISVSKDNSADYQNLKARMRFGGVVYDAVPTGIEPKQVERQFRAARGWQILRDGKPIGRIEFPPRTGSFSDAMGSYDRKSLLTVPVNAADGREAVLVFAAHLYFLPEANSPALKEGSGRPMF